MQKDKSPADTRARVFIERTWYPGDAEDTGPASEHLSLRNGFMCFCLTALRVSSAIMEPGEVVFIPRGAS